MAIPDSFAPYFYFFIFLSIVIIAFVIYRLWISFKQLVYRLTHRPPKAIYFDGEIAARVVPEHKPLPERQWTFDPEIRSAYSVTRSAPLDDAQGSDSDELTDREKEVARLALEGLSNKQIANKLSIAVDTVENHMTNIHRKLNIESRKELKYISRDRLD